MVGEEDETDDASEEDVDGMEFTATANLVQPPPTNAGATSSPHLRPAKRFKGRTYAHAHTHMHTHTHTHTSPPTAPQLPISAITQRNSTSAIKKGEVEYFVHKILAVRRTRTKGNRAHMSCEYRVEWVGFPNLVGASSPILLCSIPLTPPPPPTPPHAYTFF
jgi:hypothetical protein